MCKNRKVGLLGGTFDPIHNGHLLLADCAYRQFGLDEVRFIPAAVPPHKRTRADGATDAQRYRMVQLAIRDDPRFLADPIEMKRGGLSYTKDTLQQLKKQEPDSEFYFIIGADSLMSLDNWKNPEIICRSCHLLVAVRDEINKDTLLSKMEDLKNRFGASVYLMDAPLTPVSSHELRRMCREQKPLDDYMPEAVLSFLEQEKIYRS